MNKLTFICNLYVKENNTIQIFYINNASLRNIVFENSLQC